MTRRDFIGSSGALGAGIALAGSPLGFTLADTAKTRVVMGFNYRYGSVFTKLKQLLSEGSERYL